MTLPNIRRERPADHTEGRLLGGAGGAGHSALRLQDRAALARLATRVTFETLLARTSALRRADGEIAHVPSLLVRCLALLPVELSM